MSSPVFLDTVGLIAIWDTDDQWHTAASKAFDRLISEKTPSYCTSYILLECGNAAARKPFRDEVDALRQQLETAGRLIHPSEAEWHQAWEAYREGEGAAAGIVDQVSFLVMRRLGIQRAFTNDRHYRAAGFEALF